MESIMATGSDSESEADNIVIGSYKTGLMDMIKLTAEMSGVNGLSEECFEELYEQCVYILKLVIQQSIKFMDNNNNQKMTTEDVRLGIKSRGIDPVYGYGDRAPITFKHARGGGKEFFFIDEKEINFNDIANAPLPKVPIECTVKPYWIAINGVQPTIKESSIRNNIQEENSLSSVSQMPISVGNDVSRVKRKFSEKMMVKEVTAHELSLEQQHYYIEITEACVCPDEKRRSEALESLRVDTGLGPMLPRFCNFIFGGVKVNATQNNLAFLIYLMRMCQALLDNSNLALQPYLHEIVPSILTCIVCRQLCLKPDKDNHWALRAFAARLLCQVCRMFDSNVEMLQTRVTDYLTTTLRDETSPLATQYGAIFCLGELGSESITNFILPHVSQISHRLSSILDNSVGMVVMSSVDKMAADHIKALMLKILPHVIRQTRQVTDSVEDFQVDYGVLLGLLLHEAVMRLHKQQTQTTSQTYMGQLSASLVSGRNTMLAVGDPQSQQGGQSQVIRVASIPRNPSLGISVTPDTPARQNVVFITPQQRLPPAVSASNFQTNNISATPHFVRLIPAGSGTIANHPPSSFNEQ